MGTTPASGDARTIEIPFRWAEVEGIVRAVVATNEDPAALGCAGFARGFPYCMATVEPPARGYADVLGWLQMVDHNGQKGGFQIDLFSRLSSCSHPFDFLGFAPVFFDAPHTDELEDWDFLAHTFLCGLGGDVVDPRQEIGAVLGLRWSFSKRGPQIDWFGPEALTAEVWDSHRDYLARKYARWWWPRRWRWSFRPGFSQSPLEP